MSGLFKRLSSRRSGGPEGTEPPTAAEPGTSDAPISTPAEPEGRRPLFTDPAAETRVLREEDQAASPAADPNAERLFDAPADPNQHTLYGAPAAPAEPDPYVAPAAFAAPVGPEAPVYQAPVGPGIPVEPVADLPAGLDPDELAAAPASSARRSKLRRRVAFLRAARELLLRDLGGFVYELHRTAHDVEYEAHRRLRETKLGRLSRIDAELHELEIRLDDVRRQVLVREPGVGGECPHCGELFGSAAHYCSHCGLPLTEAARRELARSQQPDPEPAPEPVIVAEPAPVASANDQTTQEIPPLDPAHPDADAEFQWPRRDAEDSSPAATPEQTPEPATSIVEPASPTAEEKPEPEPQPAAEQTPEPAAADDDDATPEPATDDAAQTPPAAEATPGADSRNGTGHDDSILRPVERRP
jgi:hypothetical protein